MHRDDEQKKDFRVTRYRAKEPLAYHLYASKKAYAASSRLKPITCEFNQNFASYSEKERYKRNILELAKLKERLLEYPDKQHTIARAVILTGLYA